MPERTSSWNIPREKILTREDVMKVLDAAKRSSHRDYVFLAVAANTGLRVSEVVHLKRDGLLDDQLAVIRRKRKKLGIERIDLSDNLSRLLSEWVANLKAGNNWMFPGRASVCMLYRTSGAKEKLCGGGHISRREIQRRWRSYLRKAGLSMKGRGIHTLRHYAITEFYSLHRDLRAAQMFAGHSQSSITEKYAHVIDLREKVKKMKSTL